MNFSFLALFIATSVYAYSYTINMTSAEVAWYNVTNLISAIAWAVLAWLIHLFRTQSWLRDTKPGDGSVTDGTLVFRWVKPLTYALKAFCILSGVRYLVNSMVIYTHLYILQNVLYFLTNIALAIAVGYASVYYTRIPAMLLRVRRHQINSRRLEQIAEFAPDAFLELDTLSNIWFANRAAAQMFGTATARELLGRNITDLMPEKFRSQHLLGIERYLQTGESRVIDRRAPLHFTAVRLDGTEFPVELTISRYNAGDTTRFIVVIRDVTPAPETKG